MSDSELNDEDFDFLEEYGDSSFLQFEDTYKPKIINEPLKLPTKINGKLKYESNHLKPKSKHLSPEMPEMPVTDTKRPIESEPESPKKKPKQESFVEILNLFGQIGFDVMQNPMLHLPKLNDIFTRIEHPASIPTLTTIFIDILPMYRLRPEQGNLSKLVKQNSDHEALILNFYARFIDELTNKKQFKSMILLLEKNPNFNMSDVLMESLVVELLKPKSKNRQPIIDCFSKLFDEDLNGELSLKLATLITKKIQKLKYKVPAAALDPLLHLKLQKPPKTKVKKLERTKQHISKKQRKDEKYYRTAELEFREAEATYSHDKIQENQSQTLLVLFKLYYNILHNNIEPLITPVISGLLRFLELINIEFVQDLLIILKNLALKYDNHTLECVNAVFKLIKLIPIPIDLNQYYKILYSRIIDCEPNQYTMLISSIDEIMKRKGGSVERIGSFIKRSATLATFAPVGESLLLLGLVGQALQREDRLSCLLEDEPVMGEYDAYLDDPDLCNAMASGLWELPLLSVFILINLKRHYNPDISGNVTLFCKTKQALGSKYSVPNTMQVYSGGVFKFRPVIKQQPMVPKIDGPYSVIDSDFIQSLRN